MSKPTSNDLSGLIKYASRGTWRDCLDEWLTLHLGPVADEAGLEQDDLFEMVGPHWKGTLWGCAFEDLLTQEFEPDGLNIVDDYLKRRGWNEKAPHKAYMKARSEEHTSELQSLMRISYAVLCLKTKNTTTHPTYHNSLQ